MTSGHVDELIEEYVLGLLDAEEAAQVAEHAATCAVCRAKLDAAGQTAALLAAVAVPETPSPETGRQLFHRVRSAQHGRRAAAPAQPRPQPPLWGRLWPAAAALGLALAAVMVVWNFSLQGQLRQLAQENQALADRLTRQESRVALVSGPQVAVVEMGGTEDAPATHGRAYLDPMAGTVWITVSGLPAVDEAWTYQVWFIGADGPVSAGFLGNATNGRREVWLSNVTGLDSYEAVGVSLEQAGGNTQPTLVMAVGAY